MAVEYTAVERLVGEHRAGDKMAVVGIVVVVDFDFVLWTAVVWTVELYFVAVVSC